MSERLIKEIKSRSRAREKLILNLSDTILLLDIYERVDQKIYGWEGWVSANDEGEGFGHSGNCRGVDDLSYLKNKSAIALAKTTILQANLDWQEAKYGNQLLFHVWTEPKTN